MTASAGRRRSLTLSRWSTRAIRRRAPGGCRRRARRSPRGSTARPRDGRRRSSRDRRGRRSASTWNGTPSRLRFVAELGDVVAVDEVVGVVVEQVDGRRPAARTSPRSRRRRCRARCAWPRSPGGTSRGSAEIRTRTGCSSATAGSVQRDEAVGAVDQVGQHDEAAVGHGVGVRSGRRRFWQP